MRENSLFFILALYQVEKKNPNKTENAVIKNNSKRK
jgi:hypothetical protein